MRTLSPAPSHSSGTPSGPASMVCLVRGPYVLQDGRRFSIPEGSKRLLAYVALHGGRIDRRRAAGTLWPCGADERAAGNLRSALWRLRGAGIEVLQADKNLLSLSPGTLTDIHQLCDWAARVIDGRLEAQELRLGEWELEAADILPGWYDDWVINERERVRQRLLHGLEALGRRLLEANRAADAVEVAMDAVRIEPLRDSAQHLLIDAHLGEGNVIEALRTYRAYARLLHDELGISPGPALAASLPAMTRV